MTVELGGGYGEGDIPGPGIPHPVFKYMDCIYDQVRR